MSYLTVCTPTYNRAYLLKRPYESLKRQTFKDFEWLIIDDGSSDNTEEVVNQFIEESTFPIIYIKKENGGRASALNESYKYLKTKYVINLDSDDEYTPNALQVIHDIWESMDEVDKERFWCITGQCIDSKTGRIIGGLWPSYINTYTGRKQHKLITKYKKGEKSCCRRVDVLKKNPFPTYPETKFVSEAVVWEKINSCYDQYCTNEIFRIYHTDSQDSLSTGKEYSVTRKATYYYLSLFYINECFNQITYNKDVLLAILNISRCAMLIKRPFVKVMKEINKNYKKILVAIGYPIMWCFNKIYYRN